MKVKTLIEYLTIIEATHGNLTCYMGDMKELAHVDLQVGDDIVEPDKYPQGFVHFGEW